MPKKKPVSTVHHFEELPAFTSEAEEHAFWADHELSDALWDQAGPLEPGELPPPRATTAPVIIHLDEPTLRRVKALARRRHKGYRALLEELVVTQLTEEERRIG